MAITHTVAYNFSKDGSALTSFTSSESQDGEINLDVTIAAGASAFSVLCPITQTAVKSIFINCDADMTVVTKNGATTVNTFTFVGNKPLIWQVGFPTTIPFSGDFTTLAVSSSTGGNMKVCILENV
jgi:hypothetical protein